MEEEIKESVEKFVSDQVSKWKRSMEEKRLPEAGILPVVTVSMQPGSRGRLVAEELARRVDYDYFHRDMIKEIALSARMSETLIESLEKNRLSGIDDFIASIVKKHYMHPDVYLIHLMKVVNAIARHGRAVIVGRGANFILPVDVRFSVRIVAPLEVRIHNVAETYAVSEEEAKQRVTWRQSRRTAFIRQSFNADINDPLNYDLMINTANMTVTCAVEAIIAALRACPGQERNVPLAG
jgi:cytidylate kinase